MKRRTYINDMPNVNLYASEGGSNTGNCASGCTNCSSGGSDGSSDDGWVIAVVGAGLTVVGSAVIATAGSGGGAAVAATTVGPGPTIA